MDDPIERARQARRFYRLAADGSSPDSVRVPFEAMPELAQHLLSDGHGAVGPPGPRGSTGCGPAAGS